MSPIGRAMLLIDIVLLAVALAGLLARRRVSASPLFAVYLGTSALLLLALDTWPQRLQSWDAWLAVRLFQSALRLGVCLDVAVRIFGRLPRGRWRAELLLVGVATVTFFAVLVALAHPTPWAVKDHAWAIREAVRLAGHVAYAGAWMMALVLGLAHFHAVPVDRLHREIGAGLILLSLAQGCSAQLLALDPWLGIGRAGLERLIYMGALAAWAVEAWRAEEHCPAELVPVLRPWRAAW